MGNLSFSVSLDTKKARYRVTPGWKSTQTLFTECQISTRVCADWSVHSRHGNIIRSRRRYALANSGVLSDSVKKTSLKVNSLLLLPGDSSIRSIAVITLPSPFSFSRFGCCFKNYFLWQLFRSWLRWIPHSPVQHNLRTPIKTINPLFGSRKTKRIFDSQFIVQPQLDSHPFVVTSLYGSTGDSTGSGSFFWAR